MCVQMVNIISISIWISPSRFFGPHFKSFNNGHRNLIEHSDYSIETRDGHFMDISIIEYLHQIIVEYSSTHTKKPLPSCAAQTGIN